MALSKHAMDKKQSDGYYCEYGYWHSYTPNAETLAAFEETEQILRDIKSGKRKPFNTVADLMADLMSGDDEEIDL
jgi:hypothetical protein